MVPKAKAGELNLDRTLWALRRAADPRKLDKMGREGAARPDETRAL